MSDTPKIYAAIAAVQAAVAKEGISKDRKRCRRCKLVKPADEMKRDTRYGDGFSSFCKKCHQASSVEWQKNNPEKLNAGRRARYVRNKDIINSSRRAKYDPESIRWRNLLRLYGVTKEWYENKMRSQNYRCAICNRHQSEVNRAFSVDHDHSCCPKTPTCKSCTRSLLCGTCNAAIHAAERDKNWLSAVATYLEANS